MYIAGLLTSICALGVVHDLDDRNIRKCIAYITHLKFATRLGLYIISAYHIKYTNVNKHLGLILNFCVLFS